MAGFCEHDDEPLCSITKVGYFLTTEHTIQSTFQRLYCTIEREGERGGELCVCVCVCEMNIIYCNQSGH